MEILFNDPQLCQLCNSRSALTSKWGVARAAVLRQRLHQLAGVDNLADIGYLLDDEPRVEAGFVELPVDSTLSVVARVPNSDGACNGIDLAEIRKVIIEEIRDGGGGE
jgi:hypothetical protein